MHTRGSWGNGRGVVPDAPRRWRQRRWRAVQPQVKLSHALVDQLRHRGAVTPLGRRDAASRDAGRCVEERVVRVEAVGEQPVVLDVRLIYKLGHVQLVSLQRRFI